MRVFISPLISFPNTYSTFYSPRPIRIYTFDSSLPARILQTNTDMSKLITIFGATGNQGGSVLSQLLASPELSKEYKIRAVTRDTSKPKAKELASKGCEVVKADLSDTASLSAAVEGAYAVYAVTNYWELMDKAKELAQGKAITDASISAGVKHLIWSSLPHTTKLTNGKLSQIDHFVAKAEVEEYIESKKGSMIATYYMPALFMTNFKGMGMINKGPDGTPTVYQPYAKDAKYPLVDIAKDTGKYICGALVSTRIQLSLQCILMNFRLPAKRQTVSESRASANGRRYPRL